MSRIRATAVVVLAGVGLTLAGTSAANAADSGGITATVKTPRIVSYGKFTVRLQSARVPGIVTAITLMSDDKDEIDFELGG